MFVLQFEKGVVIAQVFSPLSDFPLSDSSEMKIGKGRSSCKVLLVARIPSCSNWIEEIILIEVWNVGVSLLANRFVFKKDSLFKM